MPLITHSHSQSEESCWGIGGVGEQRGSRRPSTAQTPPPMPSASPAWRRQESTQGPRHPVPAHDDTYQLDIPDMASGAATDAHLHSLHQGLRFWRQSQQRMWGDSPWPADCIGYPQGAYPTLPAFPNDTSSDNLDTSPADATQLLPSQPDHAAMRGLIPARRHTAPPRQGGGDRRVSGADSEGQAQGLAELRGDVLTQSGPRSGDPRRSGSQTRVGLQPTLARLSEEASEESDENHARPDLQYSQAGDAIGAEASQDSAELRCPENGAGGDGQEAMRSREEVEWRVRQRGRTGSEPGGPRRATADGRGQRQISMDALRAGAARQVLPKWILANASTVSHLLGACKGLTYVSRLYLKYPQFCCLTAISPGWSALSRWACHHAGFVMLLQETVLEHPCCI